MKLTAEVLENVTDFEDAATAKWLTEKLEPARTLARGVPSAEAIARMRTRVFGEQAETKRQTRIAA
jgi:hypothetical protein